MHVCALISPCFKCYKYPNAYPFSVTRTQREREWERKKLKMAYKKNVVVKVAILLFLVGVTATSVDARFDPKAIIDPLLMNGDSNYLTKSTTTACCDSCACTKSIPPQCQCGDIGETCHSGCKTCVCLLKYPPVCRCLDVTSFCYDSCSEVAKAH